MTLGYLLAAGVLTFVLPLAARAQHSHSKDDQPPAKSTRATTGKPALQPAEGASIKIVSPTKGQVLKGDKLSIEYKLTKGKRGHHAHAYVDGELVGMFEGDRGTLNGIKPGRHILELRVVTSDHTTELDATDKVEFVIR